MCLLLAWQANLALLWLLFFFGPIVQQLDLLWNTKLLALHYCITVSLWNEKEFDWFCLELICQKINLFSPCVSFFVHFMFSCCLEVKLSDYVVFFIVWLILNKCKRICIYILSNLYTVTYSKWLLQIGNILFCLSFSVKFGIFFLLLQWHPCYIGEFPLENLLLFCQSWTLPYTNKHNKTFFFLFHFLSLVDIEGDGRAEVSTSLRPKAGKPWWINSLL